MATRDERISVSSEDIEKLADFTSALEEVEKISKIVSESINQGKVPPNIHIKHYCETVALLLRHYSRKSNWNAHGRPIHAIPPGIAYMLASYAQYFAAGKLPGPLAALIGRGSPAKGPSENLDIAFAVAFEKLAKRVDIGVPNPREHFRRLYGVKKRTAQRWVNKEYDWVSPEDFFGDMTDEERIAAFKDQLPIAARRYREGGRGAEGRWDAYRAKADKDQ